VHEPELLIKMIVRLVVHKVKVSHTGILLHNKDKHNDTYVLTVSRGPLGLKIPAGFARMDTDNPLISFFRQGLNKKYFHNGCVVREEARRILRKNKPLDEEYKRLLEKVLYQMDIFDVEVCIPSYFMNDLLGMLLLGKKTNHKKFKKEELDFFIALTSDVAMALRNARLFKQLEDELAKNKRLFLNTSVALAAAIEAKDHYTHGHTERVTQLSLEIAAVLNKDYNFNLDSGFLENLHIAALLHDIGKIGVPEAILNKQAPLTEEEFKIMKTHPIVGATILAPIDELNEVIQGVKYHHERYDGNGYPEGLKEGQIPLIASIISVADSFDAMTTNRPYRGAKLKEEAIFEIERLAGQQFHPLSAHALVKIYKEGKV
jgi:putative nucleotidyltransferase with HDIG domain